jgi:hypothetical protein
VSVDYRTSGGSATEGTDYAGQSGTLVFPPGRTTETITIVVNNDDLNEVDENFFVNLSNPIKAGFPGGVTSIRATGTIANDDALPRLSISDVTVREPGSGSATATFTVTLTPASGRTVTATYTTADQTAVAGRDYLAAAGTLTISPGQASSTFSVMVLADPAREAVQTFRATLSHPVNAITSDANGVGTIFDSRAPLINGFSPGSGSAGDTVTITGTNFTAIHSVQFNGVSAAFRVNTPGRIIATVPAGATTGKITVSNRNGAAISEGTFNVTAGSGSQLE